MRLLRDINCPSHGLFWFLVLFFNLFISIKTEIISQNGNSFPQQTQLLIFLCFVVNLWYHLAALKKINSQAGNTCQLQNTKLQYINLLTFALRKNLVLFIYKSLSAAPRYTVIYSKCCIYQLISVYSLWHLRCSKRIYQGLSSAPCWSLDRHFCLRYMSRSKKKVY